MKNYFKVNEGINNVLIGLYAKADTKTRKEEIEEKFIVVNENAINELLKDCKIKKNIEDAYQVGCMIFIDAVRTYKIGNKLDFSTFTDRKVKQGLYEYLKELKSQPKIQLYSTNVIDKMC